MEKKYSGISLANTLMTMILRLCVIPLTFQSAFTSIIIDPLCSEEDSFLFSLQNSLLLGHFLPERLKHGRINVLDSVFFSLGRGVNSFSAGFILGLRVVPLTQPTSLQAPCRFLS